MKILAFIFTFCLSTGLFAQELVHWSAQFDGERSSIVLRAEMEEGWHIYSQDIDPEAGPIPTSFEFETSTSAKIIGKTKEEEPVESFDANFGSTVLYFENEAEFLQKITTTEPTEVTCIITFMVCNDSTCYPPEEVQIKLDLPLTISTK